ncbi:co-chaperone YbbN [Rhodoblastus sphagnicola]|uniref:Co-chaperone YbbN n=1 Tax=Rhodoblastus sphagnicola TaxID=333368 RepID=A0A2S6N8N9_9HYPH|nr:co-chaperone YbbN [Rhodoblastus sphagnicola]MBB4199956.1 putative thioredoxin [Rhodoblastus sphagnicola]PPQ30974.1 co-chaperone YbbN [Rhodoblastus sphagnicola]
MLGQISPSTPATSGSDIVDVTLQSFRDDVMQDSLNRPVLVDFWSPRSGPCKQLTPRLEKLVRQFAGKVRLAKMNVDEYPQIAQKLGIQSVPTVVACVQGQMAEGFAEVLPEGEIKAFIQSLLGPEGVDIEALLAESQALLEAGQIAVAQAGFAQILQTDPDHPAARAGLARCALAQGESEQARAILADIPDKHAGNPAVAAARAALALEEKASSVGDMALLLARVESAPHDHQARYDLAVALNAAGKREAAAQELLVIVKHDRKWNDEAARKLLVEFFESWGPTDPATRAARRQLSSLLFS